MDNANAARCKMQTICLHVYYYRINADRKIFWRQPQSQTRQYKLLLTWKEREYGDRHEKKKVEISTDHITLKSGHERMVAFSCSWRLAQLLGWVHRSWIAVLKYSAMVAKEM